MIPEDNIPINHILLPRKCRISIAISIPSYVPQDTFINVVKPSLQDQYPNDLIVILQASSCGTAMDDNEIERTTYNIVFLIIINESINTLLSHDFVKCKFYVGLSEERKLNIMKERPNDSKLAFVNFEGIQVPYETNIIELS